MSLEGEKDAKVRKMTKWPPTADELSKLSEDQLPKELLKFLNIVFSRKQLQSERCEKTRRFVYSVGQEYVALLPMVSKNFKSIS